MDLRSCIRAATLEDDQTALARLLAEAPLDTSTRASTSAHAARLISQVRDGSDPSLMESFLAEFGLSTKEGIALMCLAEALLRVPDAETIDDLIQDKIVPHDWGTHIGASGSTLVNASTWALMLTGRVLDEGPGGGDSGGNGGGDGGVVATLRGLVRRLGEPAIRVAVGRAMREMGAQFVLGRDINEAMSNGAAWVAKGFTYSYDMLGEAARTESDALRYHHHYANAIAAISTRATGKVADSPGISVKLSALHPRYEFGQRDAMLPVMVARVLDLARAAKTAGIGFNIDAEEADRLDLSLDVIEAVLSDESLAGWDGFGVVVQAYGQRCGPVLDWLYALAERLDRRIMVRLVKGAYWDAEIKRAQVLGLPGFPVFTRKSNTDVSYIVNAGKLLAMRDRIYPQFATHNAHSVAAILAMAGNDRQSFEFQRLHGMGEALHNVVMGAEGTRCRIYAPVGAHQDLLAYLVRRLLENGANSSFVNQIVDEDIPPEDIARDPFTLCDGAPNPVVTHPSRLFGARGNAQGWDITDPTTIAKLDAARAGFGPGHQWHAGSDGATRTVVNPADPSDPVGTVAELPASAVAPMIDSALAAAPAWAATPVAERAAILRRAADLYEAQAAEIFALTAREAGKSLMDGVAELREAVDFLNYYADQAEAAEPGTTPQGLIVCISPWNFPLAIFTGQVAAALVTGNTVIAKPAEQTPLTAARAVALLHQAGVPAKALQLAFGAGDVGAALTSDSRIGGVCFTGSTEVAKIIDRQLAQTAPDALLIAETGGLNAMIVDSTALPEQAVRDILASAFQSAGQRCSALRVLYVQEDVADDLLTMLYGAMDALVLGNPWHLSTDVGPVIDAEAQAGILDYIAQAKDRLLKQVSAPDQGTFVPPTVLEVGGIADMPQEIFGPVLHVARFKATQLDQVIEAVNARGYGLTFGLHTRIDRRVQDVVDRIAVGNVYVNRNQIGAVVGSQPFGGQGLSGTGPKAGGPAYLPRFRQAPKPPVAQTPQTPQAQPVSTEAIAAAFNALAPRHPAPIAALAQALAQTPPQTQTHTQTGPAAHALAASLAILDAPQDLPGPTGETNRLSWAPRGRVLCLGPSAEIALAQAVQALRFGNQVVVICPGAPELCAHLIAEGLPLAALEGCISPESLAELPLDAVATTAPTPALRRALAQRDGPIVPLIAQVLAPGMYLHERALCVDTTAAGGNATLLAAAGG